MTMVGLSGPQDSGTWRFQRAYVSGALMFALFLFVLVSGIFRQRPSDLSGSLFIATFAVLLVLGVGGADRPVLARLSDGCVLHPAAAASPSVEVPREMSPTWGTVPISALVPVAVVQRCGDVGTTFTRKPTREEKM